MKKTITKTLFSLFLLAFSTMIHAQTASFKYEVTVISSWGDNGIVAGEGITGDFTYVLGQTGHQVSLIVPGFMTRYNQGIFTASINNQLVYATGGQVEVKNDVEAFGTVVWDGVIIDVSDRYGSIKVGNINGFKPVDMQILLTNLVGQPFTSTELPADLNLTNYPSSKRFLMTFDGSGGGLIGELTLLEKCELNNAVPFLGCSNVYNSISF